MKNVVTRVYFAFTLAVIMVTVGSVFLMVALEDDHWIMYGGLACFAWMVVSIVVAPIMMHLARIPVQPHVPVPRWRQRYVVNQWYDEGHRRNQGYYDYYDYWEDEDGGY